MIRVRDRIRLRVRANHVHEAHALARRRESAYYLLRVEVKVVAVEGHLQVSVRFG